jgi:FtsZ-interacting cell division protein ZipA
MARETKAEKAERLARERIQKGISKLKRPPENQLLEYAKTRLRSDFGLRQGASRDETENLFALTVDRENSESTAEQSTAEQSTAEQSTVEQSTAEQSTVEQSTVEQSTAEQSTAEQSTAEQSTVEQSTVEQSTAEQSTAEQSTVEQSTVEQSTADRLIIDIIKKEETKPDFMRLLVRHYGAKNTNSLLLLCWLLESGMQFGEVRRVRQQEIKQSLNWKSSDICTKSLRKLVELNLIRVEKVQRNFSNPTEPGTYISLVEETVKAVIA